MNRLEQSWRRWGFLLAPLGTVYGAAMKIRAASYARNCLSRRRSPLPVVSVGNLVLGGSGKTPIVAWLARALQREGFRPAIVSRGYGRQTPPQQLVIVSDGQRQRASADEGGDEPVMLARALPGVPVVVCSERWQACETLAHEQWADVVILDDGFQHLALHRDVDLVLVDGRILTERLFPAGALREPLTALRRAHALLAPSHETARQELKDALARIHPNAPLYGFRSSLVALELLNEQRTAPVEFLRAKKVLAFAGIARPERFFDALRALGTEVIARALPDHVTYSAELFEELQREARAAGAEALVTTAKDAVKLHESACAAAMPLVVAHQGVEVEGADDLVALVLEAISRNKNRGSATL